MFFERMIAKVSILYENDLRVIIAWQSLFGRKDAYSKEGHK